jgi:hypothetical protein
MSIDVEELLGMSVERAPVPSVAVQERTAATVGAIVHGRSRPSSRRRVWAMTVAACLLAAAVGSAVWLHSRSGPSAPPVMRVGKIPYAGPEPAPLGRNPFARGGRRVTLADASRLGRFPVRVPDGEHRAVVWLAGREVILEYVPAGIMISEQPIATCCSAPGVTTRAGLRKEARSAVGSRVITIQGRPALLAPPDRAGHGFVQVALSGIEIAVMSRRPGTTAADLVRIAQSLR